MFGQSGSLSSVDAFQDILSKSCCNCIYKIKTRPKFSGFSSLEIRRLSFLRYIEFADRYISEAFKFGQIDAPCLHSCSPAITSERGGTTKHFTVVDRLFLLIGVSVLHKMRQ